MTKCKSVYYGDEHLWHCKYEEDHKGVHSADHKDKMGSATYYDYCSWTTEDANEKMLTVLAKELTR